MPKYKVTGIPVGTPRPVSENMVRMLWDAGVGTEITMTCTAAEYEALKTAGAVVASADYPKPPSGPTGPTTVASFDGTVWQPSNPSVVITADGAAYGPYADGGAAGATVRYLALNGQPLSAITTLVYAASLSGPSGVDAYLRIWTDVGGAQHDAIFSPGSQPNPDVGPGAHTYDATAGTWRYDDDAGSGGMPFADLVAAHGSETIAKLGITIGFQPSADLSGLVTQWQINDQTFAFRA